MPERVVVCIGTKKGLFVAEAPKARRSFALRGPFSPGVAVYAAMIELGPLESMVDDAGRGGFGHVAIL
jgi:hypothetical protein